MVSQNNFLYGVHFRPYDSRTIENMYNMRFAGRPISFFLLDQRKTDTYCHFCASFLTLLIPGSKRVEGSLELLDGEYHSWVEVGDKYVYDTSRLSVWLKDAYYERYGVLETKDISEEDVHRIVEPHLREQGNINSYVAWIRELEENMDSLIYSYYLTDHIERFKEEIGYDSLNVDEVAVEEVREEIRSYFAEIDAFIKNNPVLVKKDN